jgi:hypothetical protein
MRPKDYRRQPRARSAEELTDHDAFAAHAEVELGIDPDDLTNPWQPRYHLHCRSLSAHCCY